jgi:hypothetical protein
MTSPTLPHGDPTETVAAAAAVAPAMVALAVKRVLQQWCKAEL